MKRIYYIISLLLLFSAGLSGQITTYKPGEKISYDVQYGIITGGTATLELRKDTIAGKEVWHSRMLAKTTGLADAIFKVIDIYEVYMNPATELPVKSVRNIHEGRYKKYNVVMFDHNTRSDSTILTSDLTGTHIGPPELHDIISCFYYFRNHILPEGSKLKKGEVITINTWFTDQLYPIRLKFVGMDDVKVKGGKIRCYKFNPVTEVGRLFKTEEDVSFWFSADKNFLPVKIRFNIFVGAFMVELADYEGLIAPLEIKKR
jgi:hypothetical protein